MSEDRVCAVVVTYNRKDLLLECLKSLTNQSKPLNGIYVIDNASTDGTSELLLDNGFIEELPIISNDWIKCYKVRNSVNQGYIDLNYVRLSENAGGSGGFYDGVKRAYDDGYDWLWLMDDDAEPFEDALEKLSTYFNEENLSALAGVVKTRDNNIIQWHRGYFDFNNIYNYKIAKSVQSELIDSNKVLRIDVVSFVGVLINRKSITEIGFPKKELFIYGDDYEYSIRLRSVGQILLITDSIILHKDYKSSNLLKKNILLHTFYRVKYENYWILYFEIRNNIWLLNKYRRPLLYVWIMVIGSWMYNMLLIILLDDKKFKRMSFVTSAYIDGLKGNFDNNKPKEILYS